VRQDGERAIVRKRGKDKKVRKDVTAQNTGLIKRETGVL